MLNYDDSLDLLTDSLHSPVLITQLVITIPTPFDHLRTRYLLSIIEFDIPFALSPSTPYSQTLTLTINHRPDHKPHPWPLFGPRMNIRGIGNTPDRRPGCLKPGITGFRYPDRYLLDETQQHTYRITELGTTILTRFWSSPDPIYLQISFLPDILTSLSSVTLHPRILSLTTNPTSDHEPSR